MSTGQPSNQGSATSGFGDVVTKISTWIQVVALGLLLAYSALSAPVSPDRSVVIVGLLLVIGLVIVLEYKKAQSIENRTNFTASYAVYDNLIKEFEAMASDLSDSNHDCWGRASRELKRDRNQYRLGH